MEEVEVLAEDFEQQQRRLHNAHRVSQTEFVKAPSLRRSAYTIKTSEDHGFCGQTISFYNSKLRMVCNFCCLALIATFTITAYCFFFSMDLFLSTFSGLNDVTYWYVMIIMGRMGYLTNGVEERDPNKCRHHYQSSVRFIIDMISCFPLFLFTSLLPNNLKRLGIIEEGLQLDLKYRLNAIYRQKSYLRLHWILHYLQLREDEPGSSTLVFRAYKFFLLVAFTWFGLGCMWFFVACDRDSRAGFHISQCLKNSWMNHAPEEMIQRISAVTNDTSVMKAVDFHDNRLLNSLYWSMATASSTGYGDVRAYTLSEKVFSVFAMFIGMAIMYGMTIGGLTSLLTNFDARRSTFLQKYQAFKEEVKTLDVCPEIKDMCLRYYDYMWHRYEGQSVHSTGFLQILPENLRLRFYESCFKPLTGKADLFGELEPAFNRNLALVSEPMVYLKDQFVEKSGKIGTHMTFLKSGMLEVLDEYEEDAIANLNPGKLFGQILLVFDLPRVSSIRCKTNCEVFVLNKHDFRMVLSDYPESAKSFVAAAREKCIGGKNFEWPIPPPTEEFFTTFIQKSNKEQRRISTLANATYAKSQGSKNQAKHEMERQARAARRPSYRRQSVATASYDDDMVRLGLHGRKASRTLEEQAARAKERNPDAKASLVDFLLFGGGQRRSSSKLNDGTQLIADNANFADLQESVTDGKFEDPDHMSFLQRLNFITIINPDGRMITLWRNYVFILSIFTGLYTSYMAFFHTTPGKELPLSYPNTTLTADHNSLDALISDVENYYPNCAGSLDTFGGFLGCSQSMKALEVWVWKNGRRVVDEAFMFSNSMATQNASHVTITVPAMYDMTYAPLTSQTSFGIMNIILSYLIIDLSFYLNIFVNLRTEIVQPNGYLTDFKDIFREYNKWNRLYLDVLAVFPFEILAAACSSTPLGVGHAWVYLRLTRLIYFVRFVPAGFSRFEYSLDVNINRIRALKVVVYLFFVTHIFSCLFYFGACSYYMQSHLLDISSKCRIGSWAWSGEVAYDSSQVEDYVKTIYWATTTMSSTGYGDITSYTASGRMISMVVMLLGTFMYGWIIAVIASTVSNNEAAETSYSNRLEDTKKYLKIHNVPKALINRVMDVRYIEWQRYQGTAVPGGEVIGSDMGENFKTSLLYEVVHEHIIGLPFFKGIDESFITTLCACAHTYHYSEGDIIVYTGDLSRNLCIVRSGHCDVVTEDLSTIVEHLKPGDYFGEIEVLFGCGSPRTVVADTFCEIIILSRDDIDSALKSFPMVGHHFHKIENDSKYKDSMINTMKERADRALRQKLPDKDMTSRYKVVNVIDEIDIYSSRTMDEQFLDHQAGDLCFNSNSIYYVYYELYRAVAIVCTMATVPLLFSVSASSTGLWAFQYTLDFLCFVDQIVKGYTGYFNKKRVYVTMSSETWKNYIFRGSFMIDFISWFPFELFVLAAIGADSEQKYRLVGLIRIFRLLQFYKIKGFIDFWLHDIRTKRRWAFHVQSLLIGLMLHHWVACILFVMSCRPSASDYVADSVMYTSLNTGIVGSVCHKTSWLGRIMANPESFPSLNVVNSTMDQYIVSLYWGSATLVAVGYGDISAGLVPEMAIATIIMLAGTVYYSYVIGEISSNIQMADIRRGHFKGRLSDILHFFKVYNLSPEIKAQVYKHYCYMWDRTKGVSPNELLKGLPPTIKTSVCQSMYIDMIKEAFDVKSLEEYHDDKDTIGFFRLVSTMIKPCLFLKGNVICRKGDAGEEMFFIQRGHVGLEDDNGQVVKVLGPGQHFGEVALLCTCNRTETITALTNCDITVLSRKDLDGVLTKFPQFSSQLEKTAHDRRVHGVNSLTYTHTPSEAALANGIGNFDAQGRNVVESGVNKGIIQIVLDRDHMFSRCFDQITIVMGVFSACLALCQIAFHNHSYSWYILAAMTDIWFLCDMLKSFHTSYLDRFKTNVDNLLRIHRNYFRSRSMFVVSAFALDAVANVPLGIMAWGCGTNTLTVLAGLRLTRMLRMHKVLSIFNVWENDIRRDALLARIYKFCLCGMFTINSLSCFWYLISCPKSVCGAKSWASVRDTDYLARNVRGHNALPWVDGLYWAVATMTTTGYGDISPETQGEMFYSCIAMVIGKMFVGYVLGMVGATLANDESLRVWYEGNVNIVKSAMKDLNFKSKLEDHIVQYYNYMWLKNHGTNVMKLFPDLAFSLRADIYSELCWDLVKKIELFRGCPDNFMRHVCTAVTPIAYMPGDYITFEGDIRTELYIIRRGVAEAFMRKDGEKVPLRLVCEGEVFLPESILCKVKRPCSLRCVPGTYVDVFVLTMETLQEVLVYYPEMREHILNNAKQLYPNLELQ